MKATALVGSETSQSGGCSAHPHEHAILQNRADKALVDHSMAPGVQHSRGFPEGAETLLVSNSQLPDMGCERQVLVKQHTQQLQLVDFLNSCALEYNLCCKGGKSGGTETL